TAERQNIGTQTRIGRRQRADEHAWRAQVAFPGRRRAPQLTIQQGGRLARRGILGVPQDCDEMIHAYTPMIGVNADTRSSVSFRTTRPACTQQWASKASAVTPNTQSGYRPSRATKGRSGSESNRHR